MLSEVKTLISNPWFYGTTLVGILAVGIWSSIQFSEKDFHPVASTQYIQKRSLDDSVIGIVFAGIWLGNKSFAPSSLAGNGNNPLEIIEWTRQLAQVDIVELLTNASERSNVLLSYNQNVDQALKKASEIEDNLRADIANYTTEATACESVKKWADQEYFAAITTNDPSSLNTSLKESIEQGKCSVEYRILINANTTLLSKVSLYRIALARKNEIVTTNQELLLENMWLVNSTVLDQLLILRKQLNQTTLQ